MNQGVSSNIYQPQFSKQETINTNKISKQQCNVKTRAQKINISSLCPSGTLPMSQINKYSITMLTQVQINHYNVIELEAFELNKQIKTNISRLDKQQISTLLISIRDLIDEIDKFCRAIRVGFVSELFQKITTCLLMICAANYYVEEQVQIQTQIYGPYKYASTTADSKNSKLVNQINKKKNMLQKQLSIPPQNTQDIKLSNKLQVKKSENKELNQVKQKISDKNKQIMMCSKNFQDCATKTSKQTSMNSSIKKLGGICLYNQNYKRHIENQRILLGYKDILSPQQRKLRHEFWSTLQREYKQTIGLNQESQQKQNHQMKSQEIQYTKDSNLAINTNNFQLSTKIHRKQRQCQNELRIKNQSAISLQYQYKSKQNNKQNLNTTQILAYDFESRKQIVQNIEKVMDDMAQIYRNQKENILDAIKKVLTKVFNSSKQKLKEMSMENIQLKQEVYSLKRTLKINSHRLQLYSPGSINNQLFQQKAVQTSRISENSLLLKFSLQQLLKLQKLQTQEYKRLQQSIKSYQLSRQSSQDIICRLNKKILDLQKQKIQLERNLTRRDQKCKQLKSRLQAICSDVQQNKVNLKNKQVADIKNNQKSIYKSINYSLNKSKHLNKSVLFCESQNQNQSYKTIKTRKQQKYSSAYSRDNNSNYNQIQQINIDSVSRDKNLIKLQNGSTNSFKSEKIIRDAQHVNPNFLNNYGKLKQSASDYIRQSKSQQNHDDHKEYRNNSNLDEIEKKLQQQSYKQKQYLKGKQKNKLKLILKDKKNQIKGLSWTQAPRDKSIGSPVNVKISVDKKEQKKSLVYSLAESVKPQTKKKILENNFKQEIYQGTQLRLDPPNLKMQPNQYQIHLELTTPESLKAPVHQLAYPETTIKGDKKKNLTFHSISDHSDIINKNRRQESLHDAIRREVKRVYQGRQLGWGSVSDQDSFFNQNFHQKIDKTNSIMDNNKNKQINSHQIKNKKYSLNKNLIDSWNTIRLKDEYLKNDLLQNSSNSPKECGGKKKVENKINIEDPLKLQMRKNRIYNQKINQKQIIYITNRPKLKSRNKLLKQPLKNLSMGQGKENAGFLNSRKQGFQSKQNYNSLNSNSISLQNKKLKQNNEGFTNSKIQQANIQNFYIVNSSS